MAKQATVAESKPGIITRVTTFYDEVLVELRKVTWPTMEDLKVNTRVCLIMLLFMAAITFAYDQVFNGVIMALLSLGD